MSQFVEINAPSGAGQRQHIRDCAKPVSSGVCISIRPATLSSSSGARLHGAQPLPIEDPYILLFTVHRRSWHRTRPATLSSRAGAGLHEVKPLRSRKTPTFSSALRREPASHPPATLSSSASRTSRSGAPAESRPYILLCTSAGAGISPALQHCHLERSRTSRSEAPAESKDPYILLCTSAGVGITRPIAGNKPPAK